MSLLRDRLLQIVKISGHTFVPTVLTAESVVLDLGANRGSFISTVRSRYGCRCYAVEANPRLSEQLRGSLGVPVFNYAVGAADEPVTFYLSHNTEASSLFPPSTGAADGRENRVQVQGRSLARLLNELGLEVVDLLKVDIEGAEIEMFMTASDETLRRCGQITVEFHNLCGLGTVEDVYRVVSRVEQCGFEAVRFDGLHAASPHPDAEDHLNWLFMRRDAAGLSRLRRLYVRYPILGLRRVVQRTRRMSAARTGNGVTQVGSSSA